MMRSPNLVTFALVAGSLATSSGHLLASSSGGEQPANVLLIVADDVGLDSVDAYQVSHIPAFTPNIDRLAEEGVMFRNVWANPTCSSTRALIQTGRYAFRNGLGLIVNPNGNGWSLQPGELIIPEALDLRPDLGFQHATIGKWHLTNNTTGGAMGPNLAGYGHHSGALDNLTGQKGYTRWNSVRDGIQSVETRYATATEVDYALEWLEDAQEPWFLHLSFHSAHNPFHSPPQGTFTGQLPDVDPREHPRPFYRAMVENLDREVQRMLDGLGDARANTNVIFIGDNGTPDEVTPDPIPEGHGKISPYEAGIRVPMIVQGPAVAQPGREVEFLTHLVDIYPTVLELCGLDLEEDLPLGHELDGISFLPYIENPSAPRLRETIVSELFTPNEPFGPNAAPKEKLWRMVRDPRYKLIRREVSGVVTEEFYDLFIDPHETQDLLRVPSMPANKRFALIRLREALDELPQQQ